MRNAGEEPGEGADQARMRRKAVRADTGGSNHLT